MKFDVKRRARHALVVLLMPLAACELPGVLSPEPEADPLAGALTGETIAAAVGALLPEGAVVCDEANTSGLWSAGATAGAPPHDWLTLTGGAIGVGVGQWVKVRALKKLGPTRGENDEKTRRATNDTNEHESDALHSCPFVLIRGLYRR